MKDVLVFLGWVLVFKCLFDYLDYLRKNARNKHEALEAELKLVRAKRALLVREAWERHCRRKERYYQTDNKGDKCETS